MTLVISQISPAFALQVTDRLVVKWGNSPRVVSRISDAIGLAKRIYDRMKNEYPALR